MNKNLENLIPKEIEHLLDLDLVQVTIVLKGTSANSEWPCVKIWCNDQLVDIITVIDTDTFFFNRRLTTPECVIKIEYANKKDHHVVFDNQFNIIENQTVTIESIIINGVDLMYNGLISRVGQHTMNLTQQQLDYYLEHNLSFAPNLNLTMYENGQWILKFPMPILNYLISLSVAQESWEKWPDTELLEEIYQLILQIEEESSK